LKVQSYVSPCLVIGPYYPGGGGEIVRAGRRGAGAFRWAVWVPGVRPSGAPWRRPCFRPAVAACVGGWVPACVPACARFPAFLDAGLRTCSGTRFPGFWGTPLRGRVSARVSFGPCACRQPVPSARQRSVRLPGAILALRAPRHLVVLPCAAGAGEPWFLPVALALNFASSCFTVENLVLPGAVVPLRASPWNVPGLLPRGPL